MIDVGIFLPGKPILNFLKSVLIEINKDGIERQSKDGSLRASPTAPISLGPF
jgi:hypothetical protein